MKFRDSKKLLSVLLLLLVTVNAHAWVYSDRVTITQVILWQDNAPVYFKLSNGVLCYLPAGESNLYSLVLTLHTTGKMISIHCHDGTENYGGYNGHRVHRLIAVP